MDENGDKNTAFFHSILKARKNKNIVESICDEKGNRFEGEDVAIQFVKHFEDFLGTSKPVNPICPEIFTQTLSMEDAENMVREVNDSEIKEALFDIDGDKASGPDGFSSEFFKKAWDVIGKDFCLAVKEFFRNGKLLGEINATIIAFIPKVNNPNKVSEFKPIACCNVLYKCICKILTNRIKSGLDKIVHINQSAFIPGRHIQDNILIAQELLRGYNRKNGPKRCAMQIDIQKAYDTCITSSKLSICLNGGIHGHFKGGRGLRQGDLISPYLFTLVMEVFNLIIIKNISDNKDFGYHFGCKELKLSHICFADDLLVLCKGNKESLLVIKHSLEEFSQISSLSANLGKSVIFFGSVNDDVKRELLQILPFKCGKLPVRYLGVPLLAKRLSIQDCKVLIDKVKSKINCWRNKTLSYAGRIQLIASVLTSMQLYWASVYLLPSSVVNDIDKLLKRFLWNASESAKGKARIAWKVVCRPKEQGGNGKSMSMWYDKWSLNGPVGDFISQRHIYDARLSMDAKVNDMIEDNHWIWPDEWFSVFPEISNTHMPALNDQNDKVLWVTNAGQKGKLLTQDKMEKWNNNGNLMCGFCNSRSDSHDNLFFQCDYAKKTWKEICKVSYKDGSMDKLDDVYRELIGRSKESKFGMVVDKLILAATVYYIWQERNRMIFNKEKRDVETLCNLIKESDFSDIGSSDPVIAIHITDGIGKVHYNDRSLVSWSFPWEMYHKEGVMYCGRVKGRVAMLGDWNGVWFILSMSNLSLAKEVRMDL
ncbi:RNA-directed DNA polymerase, eukaryota, reverse transcriptase zinc-binding domain protein [Tanacetum coccineum]|uniref:RNA-directed DNA polymerase, eukaryota, reverse transcriptase zinc-binding domain protein n=1 Tax=Tanacetum coccineum TaxID=301880 RepID=A0ABQ5EQC2_9ASTR